MDHVIIVKDALGGKPIRCWYKKWKPEKGKEINVVIGRINDFDMKNQRLAHWTMVREAQVEVAESLARTAWVNTDDLNGKKNDIHALGDGYKILGERFAKKALKLLAPQQP